MTHSGKGSAAIAASRRRSRPLSLFMVSIATTAALGVVLYVVSTSLPFLATSPTTDPHFGSLNQCVMAALPELRLGFAVSFDGQRLAAFDASRVALCAAGAGAQVFPVPGVSHLAFDAQGILWMALEAPREGARLWFQAKGGPPKPVVGDLSPVALAGSEGGAVLLEASGRLLSVQPEGSFPGFSQLPLSPVGPFQLVADGSGKWVAVLLGGKVFVYAAGSLEPLPLGAQPCAADYLWWAPAPGRMTLSCAAGEVVQWSYDSGAHQALAAGKRVRSALLPGRGFYVQPCDQLPCTAPAP